MNPLAHVGDVLEMHARMFPEKIGARDLDRAMTFRVSRSISTTSCMRPEHRS